MTWAHRSLFLLRSRASPPPQIDDELERITRTALGGSYVRRKGDPRIYIYQIILCRLSAVIFFYMLTYIHIYPIKRITCLCLHITIYLYISPPSPSSAMLCHACCFPGTRRFCFIYIYTATATAPLEALSAPQASEVEDWDLGILEEEGGMSTRSHGRWVIF